MATMTPDDVLSVLSGDLREARRLAAHWLDRADALSELLNRADALAVERNQLTLSPEQLREAAKTERERAELHALLSRAYPNRD